MKGGGGRKRKRERGGGRVGFDTYGISGHRQNKSEGLSELISRWLSDLLINQLMISYIHMYYIHNMRLDR